jgi:hypothetical protein
MKENISVIISAHNEEEYIVKTLESFSKNDIPYELVIICDTCSDKTSEIAKRYTSKAYNVDFKNISKVRNFGAEKASGDILVFGDADTLVSENYLLEVLKATNAYDYGCAKWISEYGSFLSKYIVWNTNIYNKKHIGGNFFIKKNIFKKVGGFNEKMKKGEDTDLGNRLKGINVKNSFIRNCYIIPSERKYKENGYIYLIIKSGIEGFLYKFFRNYYNKKIANFV